MSSELSSPKRPQYVICQSITRLVSVHTQDTGTTLKLRNWTPKCFVWMLAMTGRVAVRDKVK